MASRNENLQFRDKRQMRNNKYYDYITTNRSKSTLYIGVTNNLARRLYYHHENRGDQRTFAGKYHCYNLVYCEVYENIEEAINREKDIVMVDCEGNVEYLQIYYGDFLTFAEIRDFPFDDRPLKIDIISKEYGPDDVEFILDEGFSGRADEISIADWYISSFPTTQSTEYLIKSRQRFQDEALSRFIFEFSADRNTRYYTWKVIFPMFLIIFMSWTVFWIPPSQIGPQIGLSVTSMLTLIAYRFAIGNIIPNVDYLTRFDKFVFGSTLLIFLALVEAVTTGSLSVSDRGELAQKIDWFSRIFFPVAFVLVVLYAFLL